MLVVLDTGPLGLVTNPRSDGEAAECSLWLEDLLTRGISVRVPEIADYELRRELLRANRTLGLARLDALDAALGLLLIDTTVMRKAAEFWASARNQGRQTADDKALDGDMILSAQAALIATNDVTVVATTNVGHLSLFCDARLWSEIH